MSQEPKDITTKTPFKKQLRWKIDHPPEGSATWTVTPDMAGEMLTYNTGNRRAKKTRIKRYARDMKNGKWLWTREPIIFSQEASLQNGQNRLMACIESGCSFVTDVVFGAPREAFIATDTGAARTAADAFQILEVKDAALSAAATRWLCSLENGLSDRCATVAPTHGQITNDEIHDAWDLNPDLAQSIYIGRIFAKNKLAPPSLMAALHCLMARKDARAANEFFEKFGAGLNLTSKKNAAFRLREDLIQNRGAVKKKKPFEIAFDTVHAWNSVRNRRYTSYVNRDENPEFPEIE